MDFFLKKLAYIQIKKKKITWSDGTNSVFYFNKTPNFWFSLLYYGTLYMSRYKLNIQGLLVLGAHEENAACFIHKKEISGSCLILTQKN